MQWVSRTDSHAQIWGAGLGAGALADGLRSLGDLPLGMYLNVDIGHEISAFLSVQFNKQDTARQVKSLMRSASQMNHSPGEDRIHLKSFDVKRDGGRLDLLMRLVAPKVASPTLKLP